MFTILVDGDNIDIIEEWAKGLNVDIEKISEEYHQDKKDYKNLVNFCKEKHYNAILNFQDIDDSGYLFVALDNVEFRDFIPTKDITMQVYSSLTYNGFSISHSYYTILSKSYVNSVLSKLKDMYNITECRIQKVSDMISIKNNNKPSEKLNSILKSKSKKKRNSVKR